MNIAKVILVRTVLADFCMGSSEGSVSAHSRRWSVDEYREYR